MGGARRSAEELLEQAEEHGRDGPAAAFRRRAALLLAALGVVLAATSLLSQVAIRGELNANVRASDARAALDAARTRQTSYQIAAEQLRAIAQTPALAAGDAALRRQSDSFAASANEEQRANAAGSIPQLKSQVDRFEHSGRDAERRLGNYEFAEVLLEAGVVTGSLAIGYGSPEVLWFTATAGALGLLLFLNGLLLLVG